MGIMFSPGCADCGCPGGGGTISTPCCEVLLPETINVTITGSACPEVDGQTFPLTYNGAGGYWEGFFADQCHLFGGNQDLRIRFQCQTPFGACEDFVLTFQTETTGTGTPISTQNNGTPVSCSCDPLAMVYTMNSGFGPPGFFCCNPGGSVTATVTI